MNHSLWVPDELADGDEHPTDVASWIDSIWMFPCSRRLLIGNKPHFNHYEWLDIVFALEFMELGVNWDENHMKVILGLMNWGFL